MTGRFEFRPLGLWDRPVTAERAPAGRFRAVWDDTINLLLREVEYLDGGVVVVQVDVEAGKLRRDGMLRAHTRVDFPGVKVSFESRHGPLTYATDAYETWQANVRAIALALGALRAVDRYGVTGSGEQYRGWSQITAKPAEDTLTPDEARRVLADTAGVDVASLTTADAVRWAYRAAAKATHPDIIGGDGSLFRLVGAARNVLLGQAGPGGDGSA